jgi:hypothetical protein
MEKVTNETIDTEENLEFESLTKLKTNFLELIESFEEIIGKFLESPDTSKTHNIRRERLQNLFEDIHICTEEIKKTPAEKLNEEKKEEIFHKIRAGVKREDDFLSFFFDKMISKR